MDVASLVASLLASALASLARTTLSPHNPNPPLPTLALTYSLTARFYYGTASNDEWLVYKSALWLTSRHPLLAATLRDSEDGELCLIEAAEALPDWVSPENSENR